jgi:DNA mismatch repair protein MutL
VCNALDAGATRIHVTLDAKHAAVRCEDNGSGVPASHMALLATRYATSKGTNLDAQEGGRTLGFKGEALASLAGAQVRTVICPSGLSDRAPRSGLSSSLCPQTCVS